MQRKIDWASTAFLVLILTLVLAGIAYGAMFGFGLLNWVLFGAMYIVSGLGITVAYHRLTTHKGIEVHWTIHLLLLLGGLLAFQGSVASWALAHILHHKYSDTSRDAHSPQAWTPGIWARVRAFTWAHFGWVVYPNIYPESETEPIKQALMRNRAVRIQQRVAFPVALFGLFLPAFIMFGVEGTGQAFLEGIFTGAFRVFLLLNATWSINSVCHLFGARPNNTGDLSTNFPSVPVVGLILALLALGEPYHNNHHADQTAAYHGWEWHDVDPSKWFIQVFAALRIFQNVRKPRITT